MCRLRHYDTIASLAVSFFCLFFLSVVCSADYNFRGQSSNLVKGNTTMVQAPQSYEQPRPSSGLAIASMVLGIISLVAF